MKCPICGENTITVTCYEETQGEPPMTGTVTFVDDWDQECDCVFTPEQVTELEDNLICDDPDEFYGLEGDL